MQSLHAVPPPLDVPAVPPWIFVGREREVAQLTGELAAVAAGEGRLLLLGGESGIGKSRLAEELASIARARGFDVLWGSGQDGDTPAYWPWIQIIRAWVQTHPHGELRADLGPAGAELAPLVPDAAGCLDGKGDAESTEPARARFHLHDGLLRFARAAGERRPLLLVLDDLDRADAASLALLRFFAARLVGARLALLATFGDLDDGQEAARGAVLAALAQEPTTRRLVLRGLDQPAIARWLAQIGGIAPAALPAIVTVVTRRSAGNPFFVGELMRLLADEGRLEDAEGAPIIPAGVRAVVGRRLARLSGECRSLLPLLAVIGHDCPLPLVEHVAGIERSRLLEHLGEAVRARILLEPADQPGHWVFRHGLVQETLYDEIAGPTRAHLHRAAGQALVLLHAGDPHISAATVARHFFAAAATGCVAEAVEWSERAARQAGDRRAWADQVRQLERALHALMLAPPVDGRRRVELLLALGEARTRAGNIAAARAALSAAADLAGPLDAGDLLAAAALRFRGGQFSQTAGTDSAHVQLLEAARQALGANVPRLRARVTAKLALEHLAAGDTATHAALADEALMLARTAGDPAALAAASMTRHWGLFGSVDLAQRSALAGETIRLARAAGDREKVGVGHFHLLVDLIEQGDLRGVHRLLHAPTLREQLPLEVDYWRAVLRGFELLLRGRFDDAEAAAGALAAFTSRVRPDQDVASVLFGQQAVLRREQGRVAEIEPVMRAQVDPHPGRALADTGLALLHAQIGRDAEAREVFRRLAARGFEHLTRDAFFLPTVAMLAELAVLLDERAAAEPLHALLLPYGTRAVVFGYLAAYWGSSAMYLGLLAAVLGRSAEAEEHFAAALAFDQGLGAEPWTARTRCHWAALLLHRDAPGDRERAAALAAAAADTTERLGMPVVLERALSLKLAAQGRTPGSSEAVPTPLASPGTGVFLRDGDVWTLGWDGTVVRVRDAKGLRYLARLLRRPGERLAALALVRDDASDEPPPGTDAGAAERARSAVTQRIRGALRRIAPHHPALAAHLRVHVRTGTQCRYLPDSSRPVRWLT